IVSPSHQSGAVRPLKSVAVAPHPPSNPKPSIQAAKAVLISSWEVQLPIYTSSEQLTISSGVRSTPKVETQLIFCPHTSVAVKVTVIVSPSHQSGAVRPLKSVAVAPHPPSNPKPSIQAVKAVLISSWEVQLPIYTSSEQLTISSGVRSTPKVETQLIFCPHTSVAV